MTAEISRSEITSAQPNTLHPEASLPSGQKFLTRGFVGKTRLQLARLAGAAGVIYAMSFPGAGRVNADPIPGTGDTPRVETSTLVAPDTDTPDQDETPASDVALSGIAPDQEAVAALLQNAEGVILDPLTGKPTENQAIPQPTVISGNPLPATPSTSPSPFSATNPEASGAVKAPERAVPEKVGDLLKYNIEVNNENDQHGIDIIDLDTVSRLAKQYGTKIKIVVHKSVDEVPGYNDQMNYRHVSEIMWSPEIMSPTGKPAGAAIQYGISTTDLLPDGTFVIHYGFRDNIGQVLNGPLFTNGDIPDTFAGYRRTLANQAIASNLAGSIQFKQVPLFWPILIDQNGISYIPFNEDLSPLTNPNLPPLLQLR